jgi:uroporphyrinogen-III synthase
MRGFIPDYTPAVFNSESLARGLAERMSGTGSETVLLARSRQGSAELPLILGERGIRFGELALYDAIPIGGGNSHARRLIETGCFDMVFFSSAMIVSSFADSFPGPGLSRIQAICIGAITAKRAGELGMTPIIADEASIEAMCGKAIQIKLSPAGC